MCVYESTLEVSKIVWNLKILCACQYMRSVERVWTSECYVHPNKSTLRILSINSEIKRSTAHSRQIIKRGRRNCRYNFCTMSNLSLKPIDSFFGSYFLRSASWALSSLALIFRFKPCRDSLLPVTFPFPVPCTCAIVVVSFLILFPFSWPVSSRSLSFSLSFSLLVDVLVALADTVLLSLCNVSFDPLDFCAFWK